MKLHDRISIACLAAVLALAPACKKQEDKPSQPPAGSAGSSGSAPSPGGASSVPADAADHITVLGRHKNPKPSDPVRLEFQKFRVVKAAFDPKKIEGGTATIELDLSSFRTASDERDDHLKSAAYLDVAKLATATSTIDNVKPKAGSTYTANATVAAQGMTKTYPVTFDVLAATDDSVRIKGQHTVPRLDFAIGSDPAQNPEEQVGTDVTIEMVLTLKQT
jgi:polyisoprenoid-binding protein YceI